MREYLVVECSPESVADTRRLIDAIGWLRTVNLVKQAPAEDRIVQMALHTSETDFVHFDPIRTDDRNRPFGQVLEVWRNYRGFRTQKSLSKATGVPYGTIQGLEDSYNKERRPRDVTLQKFAEGLRTDPRVLDFRQLPPNWLLPSSNPE